MCIFRDLETKAIAAFMVQVYTSSVRLIEVLRDTTASLNDRQLEAIDKLVSYSEHTFNNILGINCTGCDWNEVPSHYLLSALRQKYNENHILIQDRMLGFYGAVQILKLLKKEDMLNTKRHFLFSNESTFLSDLEFFKAYLNVGFCFDEWELNTDKLILAAC